ncbi:hypothetical protein PUN28_008977 [Cardiocondyla obscurior]|uniref:Secreted protein n=1 Tax=Cardiocondyla obscurior TaxID=286306 RepID=A0AAW2FS75_9HYME
MHHSISLSLSLSLSLLNRWPLLRKTWTWKDPARCKSVSCIRHALSRIAATSRRKRSARDVRSRIFVFSNCQTNGARRRAETLLQMIHLGGEHRLRCAEATRGDSHARHGHFP